MAGNGFILLRDQHATDPFARQRAVQRLRVQLEHLEHGLVHVPERDDGPSSSSRPRTTDRCAQQASTPTTARMVHDCGCSATTTPTAPATTTVATAAGTVRLRLRRRPVLPLSLHHRSFESWYEHPLLSPATTTVAGGATPLRPSRNEHTGHDNESYSGHLAQFFVDQFHLPPELTAMQRTIPLLAIAPVSCGAPVAAWLIRTRSRAASGPLRASPRSRGPRRRAPPLPKEEPNAAAGLHRPCHRAAGRARTDGRAPVPGALRGRAGGGCVRLPRQQPVRLQPLGGRPHGRVPLARRARPRRRAAARLARPRGRARRARQARNRLGAGPGAAGIAAAWAGAAAVALTDGNPDVLKVTRYNVEANARAGEVDGAQRVAARVGVLRWATLATCRRGSMTGRGRRHRDDVRTTRARCLAARDRARSRSARRRRCSRSRPTRAARTPRP